MLSSNASRRRFRAIIDIISRNTFLLVNGIILIVVILLTTFGDPQEGIFLGLITVLNIIIGCVQEIRAWLNLERLQLLTAPQVTRINKDDTQSHVLVEEIKKGDYIKLTLGDQVPCDGILASSHGFEVSEALITGESAAYLRKPGEKVFAGSIITSGSAILEVEKIFSQSRIALMTKSVKKYSLVLSPIQSSVNLIIKYISYVLLLLILLIVGRGFLVHESSVNIIQNIGALSSMLLPQGMVVLITLFFSYGAVYLYRKNVLLQEINAIEKIGRIKNLCIDKTGTLTENSIVVDHRYIAPGIHEENVNESVAAYMKSAGSSSQTVTAIKKVFTHEYTGVIIDDITFSSSRQFGAVHVKDNLGERVVFAGAPEIFLPHLVTQEEREWVQKYIDTEAKIGKRLMCFVQSDGTALSHDISGMRLSILAVFVFTNKLRDGVLDAILFFQDRGVVVRVISGDSPETVQAVSLASGVKDSHSMISGTEMETWTHADFLEKVSSYTIFARVKPEQKEKIIEVLKQYSFTAMIGDGANDALAIKKSDLGIAVFDGAPVTRQLASIILVKNSFIDLPNGVKLADSIIQNIEICASIFFNQVFLGFFFFVLLTISGYAFPFTPLNITFINYFTLGLPVAIIFYWIIRPAHIHVVRRDISFLRRTVPFALISAIPEALIMLFAFYGSLEYKETHGPTSLVALSFIVVGIIFFMYTPKVYGGSLGKIQKKDFFWLVMVEIISITSLMSVPFIVTFYNLKVPPQGPMIELIPIMILYAFLQYGIARYFSIKKSLNLS